MKKLLLLTLSFLMFTTTAFAGGYLPNPVFKAIDGNGNPIRGGLLYTYTAGTTSAKDAYSDRSCSTAHDNPIVLDSNGEAVVYLCGSYKLNLKTSAGGQVPNFPVDNVYGAGAKTNSVSLDDTYSCDLSAAITAIGATETTLDIDCAGTVTADKTVPSTTTLNCLHSGTLTVSNTKTLTINGPVTGGAAECFAGAGTTTFGGNGLWFNKWDGGTDSMEGVAFTQTGLTIEDSNASHVLTIKADENLSGNKTLSLDLDDTNRSVTISGDVDFDDDFTTGDTFTASGSVSLSGNFSTVGNDNVILNTTAATEVTLPTSGTLATTTTAISVSGHGHWKLIDTQTASADATLEFVTGIDSDHDRYMFVFDSILPANDGVDLEARFSVDTGSNWVTAAGSYSWAYVGGRSDNGGAYSAINGADEEDDSMRLLGDQENTAGASTQGVLYLYNPSSTVEYSTLHGLMSFAWNDGLNEFGTVQIATFYHNGEGAAVATDGVQFFMSAGNITSGNIKLYGWVDGS
ncbi:MAG: hypothetical protein GY861_02770 [bacterium]|nr:hypothetical protein [bacterium]